MFPVSFNSTGATIPNLFLPIIRRVQNKRIGARSFRTNHKWGTYGEKLFISLKTTKYLYSEWLQCWRQNGLNISIWTQQYWNNEGLNKLNNFVFDHWTIITDHQHFISWPATILKADTFLQPLTSVRTELLSSLLRISVHCNYVQVIIWFRVQFGINLYEWVFQKAEIARAASASAIHKYNTSFLFRG